MDDIDTISQQVCEALAPAERELLGSFEVVIRVMRDINTDGCGKPGCRTCGGPVSNCISLLEELRQLAFIRAVGGNAEAFAILESYDPVRAAFVRQRYQATRGGLS